MALIQTNLASLEAIVRPPCSRCGAKTWITRIGPSDTRITETFTFECPVCEVSETKEIMIK
jgi:hypothetical protein